MVFWRTVERFDIGTFNSGWWDLTDQQNLGSIILHNLFLVDKVLNAYYVKLLAPPTIIHPLYSKKNKNGTVH